MSDSSGEQVDEQWMMAETLAEHLVPLLERYDVKWRGHGVIYVDYEDYNVHTAHKILVDLSISLGVPMHRIRSRLVDLNLLNDIRNPSPVRKEAARITDESSSATDEPQDDDSEMNEEYRQE
jgi:hypothetical protein